MVGDEWERGAGWVAAVVVAGMAVVCSPWGGALRNVWLGDPNFGGWARRGASASSNYGPATSNTTF